MSTTVAKLRVRYTKKGKIRFVGHRDTARLFDRALRIHGLPIAYTEGFSPRPKVSFGLALSVGHTSDAEYLDVDLAAPVELDGFCPRINVGLPEGLEVVKVAEVDPSTMSLQQAVTTVGWLIEVLDVSTDELASSIKNALDSAELLAERTRKGKTSVVNIRPSIRELRVDGPTDNGAQVTAVLATEPRAIKVSELLRALGPGYREGRVQRTHQWTTENGVRSEPVPLARGGPGTATGSDATARMGETGGP